MQHLNTLQSSTSKRSTQLQIPWPRHCKDTWNIPGMSPALPSAWKSAPFSPRSRGIAAAQAFPERWTKGRGPRAGQGRSSTRWQQGFPWKPASWGRSPQPEGTARRGREQILEFSRGTEEGLGHGSHHGFNPPSRLGHPTKGTPKLAFL